MLLVPHKILVKVCEVKQGQSTWLFTPPQFAAQIQQKVGFGSGSDKVKRMGQGSGGCMQGSDCNGPQKLSQEEERKATKSSEE